MPTREQIEVAFFNLLETAADFAGSSRRFVHWDQVNGNGTLPFLTMIKTGEMRARRGSLPLLTLRYHVLLYTSAGMDPKDVPATAMNTLLDAIDAAICANEQDGLQTLGGLVDHVWPLGPVFVDAGDTDGLGVAAIPFEIELPWSNP